MQEKDGFFDEEIGSKQLPVEGRQSENSTLSPTNAPKTGKNNGKKKFWRTLLCIAIAAISFFVGLGVSPLFMDEEMRSLLQIKDRIQQDYYDEVTDEQFYGALFDAINEKLLDPYSAYMTKEEYELNRAQAAGNTSGTGLVFRLHAKEGGEDVYVSYARGNSPAEAAGLERGDKIVAVGETQDSLTTVESYAQLKTFVTAQAENEIFYLQYERGGSAETVAVYNDAFVENYVYYRTNDSSYAFSGDRALTLTETSQPLVGLPADTAYIRITRFYGDAARQFKKAMDLFKQQGKKHLVLDLRNNGGGYMDILTDIGAYFCKGANLAPAIAVAEDKYGNKQRFVATSSLHDEYFDEDGKAYVLADAGTASASECLIGCMADYGMLDLENICLVDEGGVAKTYGKGIMQTTYAFGLGATDAIRLTTAKIKWPVSDRCIHGVGLTPTDGCKITPAVFTQDGEVYGGLMALGIL